MPTPVLVESPAPRTNRHIHLVPPGSHPSRPSFRQRLHLQPSRPLLPELVRPRSKPAAAALNPQRYSLLAMAFAASAAPMLWLLHAAAHAIHLF